MGPPKAMLELKKAYSLQLTTISLQVWIKIFLRSGYREFSCIFLNKNHPTVCREFTKISSEIR